MSHSSGSPTREVKGDLERDSAAKAEGAIVTKEASRVLSNHGLDEKSLEEKIAHSDGVDSSYEKKCALVNHVMQHEIGMGRYQWELFVLSGFGWAADNIWLQGVAIILPQVDAQFHPNHIPFVTLSLYMGLIFGAATWGILADVIGRRLSWNITLFIAGVFGIASGAAPNFPALGVLVALLGFGIGGNLPVDGALFLEFIPQTWQWLLTVLSLWWSLGQLYASLIAWVFIGNYSCPEEGDVCNDDNNSGWRYTFYTLGATTFAMFVCRYIIFNLQESPKFLLAKGRDEEAVKVLQYVANRNKRTLTLTVEQLQAVGGASELSSSVSRGMTTTAILRRYASKFSMSHVKALFSTKRLGFNTALTFSFWALIGLAYPLYNSFLPTYLKQRNVSAGDDSVATTYRNYSIISVCGVPGSIIACIAIEYKLFGRRYTMAFFTALTGVFLFLFVKATGSAGVLGFNCASNLTQNAMYGIIYAYTPEVFPAPHRGTGNAIASALNRLFGLMSPIIASYGNLNSDAPLFVSAALFLVGSGTMILLPIETAGKAAL